MPDKLTLIIELLRGNMRTCLARPLLMLIILNPNWKERRLYRRVPWTHSFTFICEFLVFFSNKIWKQIE